MGSYTPNKGLYKADPIADAKDTFNITKMLNDNWDKLDADVQEMTFYDIASQPGVTVTEEEVVGESGFSTWTTIITKESAELARKVDVESEENGKAVWTTTITIGDKTVTYLQKETEKGWVTTVS